MKKELLKELFKLFYHIIVLIGLVAFLIYEIKALFLS